MVSIRPIVVLLAALLFVLPCSQHGAAAQDVEAEGELERMPAFLEDDSIDDVSVEDNEENDEDTDQGEDEEQDDGEDQDEEHDDDDGQDDEDDNGEVEEVREDFVEPEHWEIEDGMDSFPKEYSTNEEPIEYVTETTEELTPVMCNDRIPVEEVEPEVEEEVEPEVDSEGEVEEDEDENEDEGEHEDENNEDGDGQ